MYPFRSRLRWFAASRYRHLLRGFEDAPPTDTLVQERLASLARWVRVRDGVMVLLYLGLAGSALTVLAPILPALSAVVDAVDAVATGLNAFAGLITLVYLFITRLLGQIETDIWVLLAAND
jgi:hypothetical protein